MSTKRIRHTAKFKFQIAVEAIKSDKTINGVTFTEKSQLARNSLEFTQSYPNEKGSAPDLDK